jgi:hypothetical protein
MVGKIRTYCRIAASAPSVTSTTARRPDGGDHQGAGRDRQAQYTAYDQIDKAPRKARGITISTAHVEYETNSATTPVDCPGHAD